MNDVDAPVAGVIDKVPNGESERGDVLLPLPLARRGLPSGL